MWTNGTRIFERTHVLEVRAKLVFSANILSAALTVKHKPPVDLMQPFPCPLFWCLCTLQVKCIPGLVLARQLAPEVTTVTQFTNIRLTTLNLITKSILLNITQVLLLIKSLNYIHPYIHVQPTAYRLTIIFIIIYCIIFKISLKCCYIEEKN